MLQIDVDISKKCGFDTITYHIKDENSKASPYSVIPIIFLSKCLTPTQLYYWPTELEVVELV